MVTTDKNDGVDVVVSRQKEEKAERDFQYLVVGTIVSIALSGIVAFLVAKRAHERQRGAKPYEFWRDFMRMPSPISVVLVGMVSGVIFGFIDNAGLYYGMSALDPYLPDDPLEKAGWGNTYSDGLGAFLGTFIGVIVMNATGVSGDDAPVWANAVGIVAGCLLGIYAPKALSAKK